MSEPIRTKSRPAGTEHVIRELIFPVPPSSNDTVYEQLRKQETGAAPDTTPRPPLTEVG